VSERTRGAHGQAVLTVALAVAVLVVALLVIGRVGRTVVDRARARTAADAAALAGVRDGRARAQEMAQRNGARLIDFEALGDEVDVTVEVGSMRASARARLEQDSG
jgi:predicted dinucleotide-utilizing enzyme